MSKGREMAINLTFPFFQEKKQEDLKTNGKTTQSSLYTKIKGKFDNDIFNANWCEVDTKIQEKEMDFNYIDLFSGAGGKSEGFRQAGFKKIMSIEIDDDASATIRRNFPHSHHFERAIEDVTEQEIREVIGNRSIHMVVGGPPCQGFSVAGFRRKDDPRNQLFREFVRIVEITKPWFVVLENVPGILTMEDGGIYKAILEAFAEIGYPNMAVRILESADFGVPQYRPRAIFVGNRFGLKNPYPKTILTKDQHKPIESAISDLATMTPDTKINHEWTKHKKAMEERLAKVPPGGSLYETYRDAWKRQRLGMPSMTIKENHGGTHIHPWLNRVISAREMARLQTFPDQFIFGGTMKRAMWQIGNAVPPLLAKHVALALVPSLQKIKKLEK